jgi:hypothetical protein
MGGEIYRRTTRLLEAQRYKILSTHAQSFIIAQLCTQLAVSDF